MLLNKIVAYANLTMLNFHVAGEEPSLQCGTEGCGVSGLPLHYHEEGHGTGTLRDIIIFEGGGPTSNMPPKRKES